jgi:hypothetical protein
MNENNMPSDKKKIWFPAKKYGWGWGFPCAWQGWVVYAVWWALLFGGGIFITPRSVGLFVAYAMVFAGVLIFIMVIKGEKPRWRWGDDKK